MSQSKVTLNQAVSLAKFLVHLAAGGATIATVVGFAGSLWWVFQLFEHPRPQYCLILIVAIVVGGISRQAWSFAWCLPLLLNLALIVPLFLPSAQSSYLQPANLIPGSTLRLLLVNLDHHNQDTSPAIQYIESQNVDVVLLQEVTSRWLSTLQSNLSRYQVATSLPRENSTGVAMLVPTTPSKSVEIVATQILELPPNSGAPLIETTLRWDSREVVILGLSIARPRNRDSSAFQQVEFDAAAEWSLRQQRQEKREVVVMGDFNSTPWSGRYEKFLQDSNLRNSLRGFGLQPTWHAALPSPLMIAIDHCLHSQSIKTVSRATGANIGSDHLPLYVELRRGF
ncbi:endonuclease/exonuclease/phosphatase family protein [Allocoleopsis sp.]|uniref:endonuclease/exonuclease/phosphatase family protein n=1 Tax=Allocoleopsis sp. TaxID=3088169 RepID=UPI002FD2FD54